MNVVWGWPPGMLLKLAVLPITLFGSVLLCNVIILLDNAIRGHRSSLICVFGGLWGALGFALAPHLRPYWWLPILVEPGTLLFLFLLPSLVITGWKTSRFNLLATYRARDGRRGATIKLFRRGLFTLVIEIDLEKGELGINGLHTAGHWQRSGDEMIFDLGTRQLVFTVNRGDRGESIIQARMIPELEINPALSLSGFRFDRDQD